MIISAENTITRNTVATNIGMVVATESGTAHQ